MAENLKSEGELTKAGDLQIESVEAVRDGKQNLDNKRPVYIDGERYDVKKGHAWMVDGYRMKTYIETSAKLFFK